jgi:hypothetical protein
MSDAVNQADPLPTKLTVDLLNLYKAEVAKLDELKLQLKPVNDRVNALFSHIEELMEKTKKDVRIVGEHRLAYVEKRGNVQWKAELAKRVPSDELAKIEAAVKVSKELQIN